METSTWDVIVVGAGPAGLLAATAAAERGRRTLLLEKNARPGVKILMSGGTRCNVTHATDERGIVAAFGRQGSFLHSALAALGPSDLLKLLAAEGVTTKIEEHGKVFPVSDKAADVLTALLQRLRRSGAELALSTPVLGIQRDGDGFRLRTVGRTDLQSVQDGLQIRPTSATPATVSDLSPAGSVLWTKSLVLTTGGRSYPGCGTRGDGYGWAAEFGHTVVPPKPALTPVTTDLDWVRALRGVTVPDVSVQVVVAEAQPPQVLTQARGSFLFTHFGLSGPAILDVSRVISRQADPRELQLACDFFPDEKREQLSQWLDAQCVLDGKRRLASILGDRLPRRLVEAALEAAAWPLERRAAETARRDRQRALELFKRLTVPISGVMGFRKAEVTAGGVSLAEVDSRDMQSKRVPGLFFAGELLDLDGPIGGDNFQAAFSTGWLAGQSA